MSPTVELDEIFRTFDPKTRRAFSDWLDAAGPRRGARAAQALNDALGSLTPFAEDVDDVLRILAARTAPRAASCATPARCSTRSASAAGQLRGLITNSNRVFETTAARDRELADTFVALPDLPARDAHHHPPPDASSPQDTDPLVTQLRPAARAALAHAREREGASRPTCAACSRTSAR